MPSIDTGRHTLQLIHAGNKPLRMAASASLLLALSACANLHTIHRTTDLPGDGMAVHLDAAQRVIHVTKDGKACAEPTPDALQSYASSFGGTLSAGPDSAAVSNALRANAASVGLHSQSITLMRQQLFNICEYAQNKWLNDADVMLLMERSQDLTLGILAIEQLTGAVVARQPVLADHTDITAEAQRRLKASQDALATQAKLDLAIKKEQALQANADADAAVQVKPTALATTGKEVVMLKTAQEGASSASATDGKAGQVEANAGLAQAQTERVALEEELADKLAQSQPGASTINAGTAEHLARASTDIVKMILNKGHLTDMCITFINHPKKYVEMWQHYKEVMDQCKSVLAADLLPGTAHPYSHTMPGPRDATQAKPELE
ncbi:hypothetical protein SAMN03097694_3117 [Janthinobacterium lividum]|uniref:Uncharacterized protein n=1 Tax=Janthinobacterium lividum TaxID=29581 RepID=A0AB38CC62_9BURK|nr:hypothetical protein [Janthinobacterium lividum]SFX76135.1 hypothetical protein SAMN03097694_3117 [Janthinobacterium lividum]